MTGNEVDVDDDDNDDDGFLAASALLSADDPGAAERKQKRNDYWSGDDGDGRGRRDDFDGRPRQQQQKRNDYWSYDDGDGRGRRDDFDGRPRHCRRLCCRRRVIGTTAISAMITAGGKETSVWWSMHRGRGNSLAQTTSGPRVSNSHIRYYRVSDSRGSVNGGRGRRRRSRGGRKEKARKERRLLSSAVPSPPTKTVRVRPPPGQTCRTLPMILKGAFWRHSARGA